MTFMSIHGFRVGESQFSKRFDRDSDGNMDKHEVKKKYPRVKDDLYGCIKALEQDPSDGDPIPGWNKEIWKIRVASSDVKKGKRGGYRIIYF